MKKFVFIVLALALVSYITACGKKQPALEELQEPLSIEALSKLSTEGQALPETKTQGAAVTGGVPVGLEPLPPSGPYKPTAIEIQTALKNAGYYTAVIDGKIGPITRKAIEEFQKANNLKVDGKVGPKTWTVLSNYLKPPESKAKKKR